MAAGPLKPKSTPFAIPTGRLSRLARLGSLASGVAGGMLAEGARQLAQGRRPKVSDLLLTPANARRVAEELAQLRGAAMKVGQLLSMDAGDLLPPELRDILSRLRSDARSMPMSQLVAVLNAHWGQGWEQQFQQFSFTPMAAASIGQVHAARDLDGRRLAIKVQYPGIRQSISSDVDNVASLLRLSGLLPKTLDIQPLLDEAKRQLHAEADYRIEAAHLTRFRALLADHTDFLLPEVQEPLTNAQILVMSHVEGEPVEALAHASQAERDRVASLLFELLFRELFEFHLVQTDPNFANYRYDLASRRLILLDFGATRTYAPATVSAYRQLMESAARGERAGIAEAAEAIGYFQAGIRADHHRAVLDIFEVACEPLRQAGPYDFGRSNLATRIRDAGLILGMDRDFWHTPPADALFLHRKLGGLYLLAATLGARVDVGALLHKQLEHALNAYKVSVLS
ncbi:AarF/ABC1/UbiB kinase family protein [Zoogloea sp.]|uniref:ABC1 kinase family protein n=1 Tax=Zoogloea sp. TaxID=49181 RepID=UPI002628AFB9|nr:AarF/ABC1/UbiB kinase family protein [Zoogloea sp.]MDD3354135.1 AarF/ABC1/UbiB kinase family protein [Zoogloea sp.]